MPRANKNRRTQRNNRVQRSNRLISSSDNRVVSAGLRRSSTSIITRTLMFTGNISSTGGGLIAVVLGLDPSTFVGWTHAAALYDEFRVVGGRIHIAARNNSGTLLSSGLAVVVYDNDDDTTALVNLEQGAVYPEHKLFPSILVTPGMISLKYTCYSTGDRSTGAVYATCATPNAHPHSLKIYATSLTASVSYFQYAIESVVQFRSSL